MEEIKIDIYKRILGKVYENVGEEIYTYWEIINNLFYERKLKIPLITFEILAYGKNKGDYTHERGRIRIFCSYKQITPKTIGILLHEIIHQSFDELLTDEQKNEIKNYGQKSQYSNHNNLYWINEINRIHKIVTGEELGAGLRKMTREDNKLFRKDTGKITMKQISHYPYNQELEKPIFEYLNKHLNSY